MNHLTNQIEENLQNDNDVEQEILNFLAEKKKFDLENKQPEGKFIFSLNLVLPNKETACNFQEQYQQQPLYTLGANQDTQDAALLLSQDTHYDSKDLERLLNFTSRNRSHISELERRHRFKIESGMLKIIKRYLVHLQRVLKQRGIATEKAEMEIVNQRFPVLQKGEAKSVNYEQENYGQSTNYVKEKYFGKLNQLKVKDRNKFEEFKDKFQRIKNQPLDIYQLKKYSKI